MATCTSCGTDVTGKKFCQQCGTPVQMTAPIPIGNTEMTTCPRCNGAIRANAAFCMHCGSSLSANSHPALATSTPPPPLTHACPACHSEVPVGQAFCSNCGQNMTAAVAQPATAAPAYSFCTNCGRQNTIGVKFCAACGSPMTANTPATPSGYAPQGQYPPQQPSQYQPQQPYGQQPYAQPQYPQPYAQQPYPPQQYGPPGYQPQPMMGQSPMVLRCPVCMAMSPMGTPNCLSCHTSLAGVVPTPAAQQAQGQQGGLGGFMQGNGGKYAMGALGGAAAVIGGEMLLHGLERGVADRVEGDMGYGHHRDEGMLGGLGEIANDIGLL
jgi:hypothetical protein